MKKVLFRLFKLLTNTPFYPYWLDFRSKSSSNKIMYPYFKGKVLETGSGSGEKMDEILRNCPRITSYLATDYSSWDSAFSEQAQRINLLGVITQAIYGPSKSEESVDMVCDARSLPFENNSFHTYCCFEVLEHIDQPDKVFKEAYRVLKKNGYAIFTMPFLYREHGGIEMDFQRLTRGGFNYLAHTTGFKVEKIYTHSFFGATYSTLMNQYLICKITESSTPVKFILMCVSPIIFFISNIIGYVVDLFDQDNRFATRYHVILKKTK